MVVSLRDYRSVSVVVSYSYYTYVDVQNAVCIPMINTCRNIEVCFLFYLLTADKHVPLMTERTRAMKNVAITVWQQLSGAGGPRGTENLF